MHPHFIALAHLDFERIELPCGWTRRNDRAIHGEAARMARAEKCLRLRAPLHRATEMRAGGVKGAHLPFTDALQEDRADRRELMPRPGISTLNLYLEEQRRSVCV